MNIKKIMSAGVLAGLVFYAVSMIIWGLFKVLPVVPLIVTMRSQGLGHLWQAEHLAVSLAIGVIWAIGYALIGKGALAGGWLYGWVLYLTGTVPLLGIYLLIAPADRTLNAYGAVVALIGALLGGKAIALVAKPKM